MTRSSSPWRRRTTRRAALRSAALASAGLAAAAAVGCGDDDDDDETRTTTGTVAATGTEGAGAPRRGGTFVFATTGLAHLDIHQTSYAIVDQVSLLMFNRLLRPKVRDNTPEPDLAIAMPEQPDETTFVFRIPPDVKFHDKEPVNGRTLVAEDIVFSLDRSRTAEPTFVHGNEIRSIDRIEAVDDTTVRITTKSPDVALLTTLALPPFIIIPPEVLDRFPDLRTPESNIGTGPFMVDNWSRDTGGKFVRHPAYFRADMPYLEAVEQRNIPQDAWSQFLAGNLHTAGVPGEEQADFESRHSDLPFAEVGGHYSAIGRIMNTQRGPFDDERVRIAIGLIANRQKSIEFQWFGRGRPSVGLGQDHQFWNMTVEETEQLPGFRPSKDEDIARALELLEEAGYNRDNKVQFEVVAWSIADRHFGTPALEFLKQDIEQSSNGLVEVGLRPMEYGTWKDVEARGEFQMTTAFWFSGLDPDHVLSRFHHTDGGRNYGRYSDPELDRMLERERGTFDIDDRKELVHEIQRYIAEKSPISWLSTGPSLQTWQPYVKDFYGDINQMWQLERAWFDR